MNSEIPKVLHEVGGKPMVVHVIESAKILGSSKVVAECATLVISYKEEFFNSEALSWFLKYLKNILGNLVDI